MLVKLAPYRKTIVAVVGAILAVLSQLLNSGVLPQSLASWITGAVTFATALGVYTVPNEPLSSPLSDQNIQDGESPGGD